MGLELAEPGFASACYVEIEDYPRACLVAAQRAGYLHAAPIWDNVKTFDARPWRGIDTLIAGYPCQPFSQAGQRKGTNDPRHLWPEIVRIIEELGPDLQWCFFENVSGHLSLGFDIVAHDVRRMGFSLAAGIFSAGETDAAQERQRLFIVAYRESADGRRELEPRCAQRWWSRSAGEGGELDHSTGARYDGAWLGPDKPNGQSGGKPLPGHGRTELADTHGRDTGAERQQRGGEQRFHEESRGTGEEHVGDTSIVGRREGRTKPEIWRGRDTPTGTGRELADTSQPGPQGREQPCASRDRNGPMSSRPTPQLRRPLLHAPGPSDLDTWRAVLDLAPDLAPAASLGDVVGAANHAAQMVAAGYMAETEAESLVRRMAYGLASRSRALPLLGNGVHPLAAAYAWRSLSAAHGLGRVDLDTEGGSTRTASNELFVRCYD